MKLLKYIPVLLLTVIALFGTTSCKTSEENYKKAYEAAVEKQNEGYTREEIASMAHEEAIPKSVYKGDSIPIKGIFVNTVKLDPPVEAAQRYNIVVASFKQKFNAMSVLDRLRQAGYAEPRLLVDKEQTFYVAAVSTPSLDEAVENLREIQKNPPLAFRPPCPYILRKP